MSDDSWARCYHRPMLGLTLLLASFLGLQQATPEPWLATLSGKVMDRSGKALPGVTVKLEEPAASQPALTVTDASGAYQYTVAWCMPPKSQREAAGNCTVTFELAGFETYRRSRLTLTPGKTQ